MSPSLIFQLVIGAIALISILASNYLRSKSHKGVNDWIRNANLESQNNDNSAALTSLKLALAQVLGIESKYKWTLYEIRDNMNTDGWFIINQINTICKQEGIEFSMIVWKHIMTDLSTIDRKSRNEELRYRILLAFNNLPEIVNTDNT